jgi:hypothetical protein
LESRLPEGSGASGAFRKPAGPEPVDPAAAPAQAGQTVPQAYLVDEEETENAAEEDEDTGEAELDIF